MASRTVTGCCSLDCPDACSWVVTVEDGSAVKLRGNPDHPFTQGGLCVKVNPYIEYTNRPDRILHPLKRTGPKGSGSFVQITWEEALTEIATRFGDIIDTHGGEAIWPFPGTGTVGYLQGEGAGRRLFNTLGASGHTVNICTIAGTLGMRYTMGSPFGMNPEDLRHSRLVVLWGTNTLTSNRHLWPFVEEARTRGAEVVVIDPFRTRTAARADHHIAPLPGTDGALALGLAAELVRLGAHDEYYLSTHTTGWDEFWDAELSHWDAERAAAACDIPVATIRDLAERIARSRPTGIRTLMGMQRHAGGGQAARALTILPAITGDFARLGGGICYSTSAAYGVDHAAFVRKDLRPHRVRNLAQTHLGPNLVDLDDPPVKGLMIWAANPMVSNPDIEKVRTGLSREDLFTVVVEHVHTDTTAYADIVLPGTTQLEHKELQESYTHLYLHWNEPAVEPRGEARSHTEIFRGLAAAMGFDDPLLLASDDELATALLSGDHPSVAGITLDALKATGWCRLSLPDPCLPVADGFPTSTGTFEFSSQKALDDGHGEFPHFVPAAEGASPGDGLALVSPANHHLINSTFAGSAQHSKAGPPLITVHPDDAIRFGAEDGDLVLVRSERGAFEATMIVSADARPRVAHTTKGNTAVNATTSVVDADMGRGARYHDNRVWLEPIGRV